MVRTCGIGCFVVVKLKLFAVGKAVLGYILGSIWTAEDYFSRKNMEMG